MNSISNIFIILIFNVWFQVVDEKMLTSMKTTTCPNRLIIVRTSKVDFKSTVMFIYFPELFPLCHFFIFWIWQVHAWHPSLDAVPLRNLSDYNRWSSMMDNKINMLVHFQSQIHVWHNEMILLVAWSRGLLPLNK